MSSENEFDLAFTAGFTETYLRSEGSLSCRDAMRAASEYHYRQLGIEAELDSLSGSIDALFSMLTEKWGWIIEYDSENGVIIADENKPDCVCPIKRVCKNASSLLCDCSAGFAERLFSRALRRPVKTEILSSVIRGDASCKYKITLLNLE